MFLLCTCSVAQFFLPRCIKEDCVPCNTKPAQLCLSVSFGVFRSITYPLNHRSISCLQLDKLFPCAQLYKTLITPHCMSVSEVKQLVLSIGKSVSRVCQSVCMQTGDTGGLDRFATMRWMSTMDIKVSIVAVYLFATEATHIHSNFSLEWLFLRSPILFLYILY